MTTTAIILDVLTAAALIAFTVMGAHRGFFRTVAGLLAVILALVGAQLFTSWAAPHVSGVLQPAIERRVEKKVDAALGGDPSAITPQEPQIGASRPDSETQDQKEAEEESDVLKVAIIGKPNVGKSSLTNRILGQERVIVSNVAGTTRDAIDSYFENETGKYVFIDTAGMRKKSRIEESIEKYSVLRATMAIDRADVCLIMIDATEGVTEQDTKVAGLAHEAGKACIIVVNKWDLVEKDGKTMDKMREDIRRDLSYMTYAPILFISAATGQRVPRLFELINYVHSQACTRITTGMLNNVLEDAQTRVQPPTDKGKRLKIYYMTQVGVCPPHFVIFCNDRQLFHFSYQRYIENCIRNVFGLEGTPIILSIRQKGDKEE